MHLLLQQHNEAQSFAVSALTLLVGHQEEYPACKKLSDEVAICLEQGAMICIWSS